MLSELEGKYSDNPMTKQTSLMDFCTSVDEMAYRTSAFKGISHTSDSDVDQTCFLDLLKMAPILPAPFLRPYLPSFLLQCFPQSVP